MCATRSKPEWRNCSLLAPFSTGWALFPDRPLHRRWADGYGSRGQYRTSVHSTNSRLATPKAGAKMALLADGVSALFIDGKPTAGSAGTFPTINPATEEVLGVAADADSDDM